MGYEEKLDIKIVDTVFDPDVYGVDLSPEEIAKKRPDIMYSRTNSTSLYKVWIYLSGVDLPRVDWVKYDLYETFVPPTRTISRTPANLDCRFYIWTWGIFQVKATIMDKAGRSYGLVHQLSYGEILEKFGSSINYIEENLESSSGAFLLA